MAGSLVLTGTMTSLWQFALFDLSGGYGLAFGASCALLLVGAGLSLTINAAARPPMRRELQPVAGGR